MVAHEAGRSVCSSCQTAERANLAHVADLLVAGLGELGARQVIAGIAGAARARALEGKR